LLVDVVREGPRVRRRWRWRLASVTFLSTTLVAGGVAIATGVFTPPGAPVDTPLGAAVIATRTGTATIDLGPPPATATDLSLTLTCLTVGTFDFPNGSSASCSEADLGNPAEVPQASEVVPLTPGVDTVTIETSANASWTLQALYVNEVTTPWGVNASGETYGVRNQSGTPYLMAVVVDQGKIQGYVKSSDFNCASGGNVQSLAQAISSDTQQRNISIPVYESNGTTVIGTFILSDATGPNAQTVPLSSLSLHCLPSRSGP